MKLVDSRAPDGPGILILRDHRQIATEVRGAILAATVKDRDNYGVYEAESYGDLANASAWPKDSRPMPGWGFAWSVMAVRSSLTRAGNGGGGPPSTMIPARGLSRTRIPDTRFRAWALGYPPSWPSFPSGWSGIAVASTDEDVQRLHWHPTDPRLVAPHRGVPELSTIVTDCKGVEPDIAARLATHLFVVNAPSIQSGGDDPQVKAWMGDEVFDPSTGKKVKGTPERNVFGFNPPSLNFPQTPGFSASGKRLDQSPGAGGVYGNQEGSDDAGGGAQNNEKPAQNDGAGAGNTADTEAAREAAGWAAYEKAYNEAVAAGKGSDEAGLIAAKARNAALVAFSASGAASGGSGGGLGAVGEEGPGGVDGSIGQNSLAWLLGWSNGFHGGYAIDNEPPSGGGGTFRGPSGAVTEAGSRGVDRDPVTGARLGASAVLLPPGAGNLARQMANAIFASYATAGVAGPASVAVGFLGGVGSRWGTGTASVAPRARSLSDLGIGVGSKSGRVIVTAVSSNYAGPFHPGTYEDVHRIGTDGDGNPINPQHLSIDALFYRDRERDGPLLWEGDFRRGAYDFDYIVPVHFAFDGGTGRWGWWTTGYHDLVEVFNGPATTGGPDPRYPITPGSPPSAPPGERPGPITPGGDSRPYIGGPAADRSYLGSSREMAFAVLLGRPQSQVSGVVDGRLASLWDSPDPEADLEAQRRTPITFRLEAYGKQTDEWQRTNPENAMYRGGTAGGGLVFMPPEYRIEDSSPDGFSLSTTYFALYGTRLGFGTPLPTTGGLGSGWSVQLSGTDLLFADHDSAGTLTNGLALMTLGSGSFALRVKSNAQSLKLQDVGGNTLVEIQGASKVALFGVTPITRPAVTGARNDPEGALKNLLAQLALLGAITDSTTAS